MWIYSDGIESLENGEEEMEEDGKDAPDDHTSSTDDRYLVHFIDDTRSHIMQGTEYCEQGSNNKNLGVLDLGIYSFFDVFF